MAKKTLREYLNDDKFYYVPEIFDCMSTRAAEMNGFEIVMISSSDFACAYTGIPDLALVTPDEYASMTARITAMTDMPLFIDADEGFGSHLQTYQGVYKMVKAGADCVQLTDRNPLGKPGITPLEDAVFRLRAAKDAMAGSNCLLMVNTGVNFEENYDEFVERCAKYVEAGVDIILPIEVCRSKKFGGKWGAAKKIAKDITVPMWFPDLDPGDDQTPEEFLQYHYKFTGIHYSFRAAMYAMLDTGRHVFQNRNNEYVMEHYDYTGYHFHYSPMACFLNDGKWADLEKRYTNDPESALAVRKTKGFCGASDKLVWDGKDRFGNDVSDK